MIPFWDLGSGAQVKALLYLDSNGINGFITGVLRPLNFHQRKHNCKPSETWTWGPMSFRFESHPLHCFRRIPWEWFTFQIQRILLTEDLRLGFPIPPLMRFMGPESAYLSMSSGQPHFLINLDDHLSYALGHENYKFQARVLLQKAKLPIHFLLMRHASKSPIHNHGLCTTACLQNLWHKRGQPNPGMSPSHASETSCLCQN